MELDTRRLEIRKFIPEYLSLMFDIWGNDREVGKYVPEFDPDWTFDTFKEHIINTFRNQDYERYIIKEKKENKVIGYISLFQEDSRSKSINIYIKKEEWNKGYATEALSAVSTYLRKDGLGSIYATCDHRNIGAVKVLEKNNFEQIDKIPDERVDIDGEVGDELLYELELIRVLY